MNSFLVRSLKMIAVAFGLVAAIGFTGVAAAQDVQSTCYGCVTTTPTPQPTFAPALSFSAWQLSSGDALGQNAGGDGKGTVQTFAKIDTVQSLIARMGVNPDGSCDVACNFNQSVFETNTQIGTGALAINQGIGNSPVSSSVRAQAIGAGSMQLQNASRPVPSAP